LIWSCEYIQSNNTDLLAGSSSEPAQRRVYGNTGAEHASSKVRLDAVGDLEGEVLVSTDVAGETSLRDGAVRVGSTICVDHVGAVVLLVRLAVTAVEVGADLGTNTCAVANLECSDLGSDLDNLADNLVAYAQRQRNVLRPTTSDLDLSQIRRPLFA
jgi:hypothetical protein